MYKPPETKKCLYCDREIIKEVWRSISEWEKRKYCSRVCFGKHYKGQRISWSDRETELLKSLAEKKTISQLVEIYNQKAKKEGFNERTRNAIEIKLNRFSFSRRSKTDNFSARQLASILEITHTRIQKWTKDGLIDREKESNNLGIYSRRNFKKFAITYPDKLWGIDPKNLRRVLSDRSLVKKIVAINSSIEKDGGCAVTIIRLDTGDVFDSIQSAALSCQIEFDYSCYSLKKNIGICSKSDSDFKECFPQNRRSKSSLEGVDWSRLQYPRYFVPSEIKPEFDRLAGGLLHWFYLELRDLEGYSKTSCLIIASRNAVNLALWSFRKQQKEKIKGKGITPKEILLEKAKQVLIDKIFLFEKLNHKNAIDKIKNTFIRQVYTCFIVIFGSNQKEKLYLNAEECALNFIYETSERYFRKNYLPKNYRPQNRLENADLLAHIYASILCYVEVKENIFHSLAKLFTWRYIQKNSLHHEVSLNLEIKYENESIEEELRLDSLMDNIKKIVNPEEYEKLSLYITLKLEEASDNEIISAMEIEKSEIVKIQNRLMKLAQKVAS